MSDTSGWPEPAAGDDGDDTDHDEPWLKQMVTPAVAARLDAYRQHLEEHRGA